MKTLLFLLTISSSSMLKRGCVLLSSRFGREAGVYCNPTKDGICKEILTKDDLRNSFLRAFLPDYKIEFSKILPTKSNPIIPDQKLIKQMRNETLKGFFDDIQGDGQRFTKLMSELSNITVPNINAKEKKALGDFLQTCVRDHDRLEKYLPSAPYGGEMDFACRLTPQIDKRHNSKRSKVKKQKYKKSLQEDVLIEMQVVKQSFWDMRAVWYLAGHYHRILNRGDEWEQLRRVIGINILGVQDKAHFANGDFTRHYKFQEVKNPQLVIPAMELYQYDLNNVAAVKDLSPEAKEWLILFTEAHNMTEEDVNKQIKVTQVKEAFKMVNRKFLDPSVLKKYDQEPYEYTDTFLASTYPGYRRMVDDGLSADKIKSFLNFDDDRMARMRKFDEENAQKSPT